MIRWSYVATRLSMVMTGCVVVWLLLNPVLRWVLIQSGQSILGSKIEIGKVVTNLSNARIEITEIAVADPQRSLKNLARIKQAFLDIETTSALKRRFIVREARLSGVSINSDRTSSGQIDKTPKEDNGQSSITKKVGEIGERWMDLSLQRMEQQIEEDLHSVRLAKALKERWPREYDLMENRAKSIAERGENLVKNIETYSKQPLDHLDKFQQTFSEIDQLRIDIVDLKKRTLQTKQQIDSDKIAIQEARQHDQEYVRELLKFDALDGASVSEYLLGPELQQKLATALKWIQWSRDITSNDESKTALDSSERGISVVFPSMQTTPDFLIRKLLLNGSGTVDGKPFQFSGLLKDVTHQSQRHAHPMLLQIQSDGAIQLIATAVFDRRGIPKDQVEIDIPALALPARVLGKPEEFAVTLSEGTAKVHGRMELIGDRINGDITFLQRDIDIRPNLSEKHSDKLLTDLNGAFKQIQSVEATIDLSGTFVDPSWKLESNLGSQLAAALNNTIRQEFSARQERFMSTANQLVDSELGQFETQITKKHGDILEKLEIGSRQLSSIKSDVASLIDVKQLLGNKGQKLIDFLKR